MMDGARESESDTDQDYDNYMLLECGVVSASAPPTSDDERPAYDEKIIRKGRAAMLKKKRNSQSSKSSTKPMPDAPSNTIKCPPDATSSDPKLDATSSSNSSEAMANDGQQARQNEDVLPQGATEK